MFVDDGKAGRVVGWLIAVIGPVDAIVAIAAASAVDAEVTGTVATPCAAILLSNAAHAGSVA